MKKRIAGLTAAAIALMVICCGVWYALSFYPAQEEAMNCITSPPEGISVFQEGNRWVFSPETASAGLIFYPGGNVAAESYAPLMQALAQRGIFCVLVRMPLSLAILDMDAAEGIQANYPSIDRWYIGGHSLGGYAASTYLNQAHAGYEGLILLASYTQTDLTGTELEALTIYGSEDGVLNMDNYAKGLPLLPREYEELIIDGGCHSYFGSYGLQRGDGEPTISRETQLEVTADAVAAFIH